MAAQTLKSKVVLYLAIALSTAMLAFTALVAWFLHDEILSAVSDHVIQLSEVIVRSTRFAMLQNDPSYVDQIIHDVANQEGIDRVRILSNEGRVIFSTRPSEIGQTVDPNAEDCSSHCLQTEPPLDHASASQRTWTFKAADGQSRLGSMEVIRNEPSCYNAACHHHSQATPVLGVLNIDYSLREINRELSASTLGIAGFSLGFIVIASLSVGFFVHRLVYVPLRDLEGGAQRLSAGNLDQPIPVRSNDEFGKLAASFNDMTNALRNSRAELRDWAHTLEQKVEKRTQELRRAQAETVRGEKLASVGLLASGVAHELNNPLTGILTFSHLVRQKMPAGSPDAEDMDLVIRETKRCAAIIRRLLDFAREKAPEKKFTDLNQVIEDTVRLVERPAHLRDIEITADLDRTLPAVWIDADQIKQVVMNMLVNAQHAVEEKGSIAIRTRRASSAQAAELGADGGNIDRRYRLRHSGREPAADIRSVLHLQGGRQGHRFGTVRQSWNHRGPWRPHRSGKQGGRRIDIPRFSSPDAAVSRAREQCQRELFMSARILVVDDEEIVIRSCLRIFEGDDYQVEAVQDGREALRRIEEQTYDVMILDIMMPNIGGLEVLRRVKETHPDIDVVMVTGLSQIDTAVQAMKLGAFDYISKPFAPDEIKLVVQRALERRRLMRENLNLKSEVSSKYRFENIIGSSPQMQAVFRLVAQCAPTNSTILLTGESGTGKELIARAIHYNSLRKDKAFVAVDCNSLSENLVESELFGHVKGAFTGAVVNKKGMFEVVGAGTLFLDEIGNFSLAIQAKLLRVLQEREFRAVGDTRTQAANFRLITATNRDLKAMVAAGSFRDDLYYRINIFPIHVPALRERKDDIPALAYHFLNVFSAELNKKVTDISEGAMSALINHNWPGNVRELENVMQRAAILTSDHVIRQAHLVGIIDPSQAQADFAAPRTGDELKRVKKAAREKSVEEIEKLFVLEALKRNGWSVTKSAEDTGMLRPNFQALMKKYAIRVRDTEHDPADAEAPNAS